MTERETFSIGAFAVIFDDQGRVLLCHRRDRDLWNLPGGGVESGELPTEAAIRETREETGLHVSVERLVGVYAKPDRDELVFAFVCRVLGGQLARTDEADDCRYFDVEQLPANTIPRQVTRIRDAVAGAPQPVFRHHSEPTATEWLQGLRARS